MLNQIVTIGSHQVGDGHPPLFLPDIGTFFNQDLAIAFDLIDKVASAGLPLVKGEVLHDPSICLDTDLTDQISSRSLLTTRENYRRLIERKVLSLGTYERLFAHARNRGLGLVLSVYDSEGLDFAITQDVLLIKIASSNICHRPLIERAARSGRPTMVDSGGATLDEVVRAARWYVESGGSQLILEYSPPAPPAPVSLHKLKYLALLKHLFGCPVGLSDHHSGDEMLYAALALGAAVVEKGISPDELSWEQDLAHSLPVSLLQETALKCRNVHEGLSSDFSDLWSQRVGHLARMGLIATRELQSGHVLTLEDIGYAFPALGIGVEHYASVIGGSVISTVARGEPIVWSNLSHLGAVE
ncbi:MAG: N-acetylneuraminate synthase family protein [Burkholderiales bacterium]|nr:N,N'-diacetyllegionaminic acid synthase [Rhodocyclaceae bacterium]MCZ2175338.1 N-acetylneuraminate synthase family protein [Burkholderiales bacterium]MCZ2420968.1 N-acetylneuraminate synthase family protein [Burkholderiales bacterium]